MSVTATLSVQGTRLEREGKPPLMAVEMTANGRLVQALVMEAPEGLSIEPHVQGREVEQ